MVCQAGKPLGSRPIPLRQEIYVLERRVLQNVVIALDLSASALAGRIGGELTGKLEIASPAPLQVPRFDLSGFVRISQHLRAVAEVTDFLLLAGGVRVGVAPYLEPGFSASLRFLVSL